MLFANLPAQTRKLYQLIMLQLAAALLLGLVAGLVSFAPSVAPRADNWAPSVIPEASNTLAEFTAISKEPRWYSDKGVLQTAQTAQTAAVLEGEPESFKLLGVVNRAGKQFALFMPVNPPANEPRKVTQLTLGDTLVGDWKLTAIANAKVTVSAQREGEDPDERELLLYSLGAMAKPVADIAAKGKGAKHHASKTGKAAKTEHVGTPKHNAAATPKAGADGKSAADKKAERAERKAKRQSESKADGAASGAAKARPERPKKDKPKPN